MTVYTGPKIADRIGLKKIKVPAWRGIFARVRYRCQRVRQS